MIISVDDGYVDDVTRILPALQHFHMVATFFVITGRMTEPGFLNAGQIRELDRAGMDVGDHTAHHVDLRLLTPAELRMETTGSRRVLEQCSAIPSTSSPIRSVTTTTPCRRRPRRRLHDGLHDRRRRRPRARRHR